MKEITAALVKVQAALKPVELDKENPFFHSRYSTLSAVLDSCRELLAKNGLALVQTFKVTDKGNSLVTTLLHTSGESLSGEVLLNPTKNDPQQMGSATTYFRRYSVAALLGLVSDSDDDGAAASQPQANTVQNAQKSPISHEKPSDGPFHTISDKQSKRLFAIAMSHKWEPEGFAQELKDKFGYKKTNEIKPEDYDKICKYFDSENIEPVPF